MCRRRGIVWDMLETKLKQARESYRRRAWSETYQLLSVADQASPLTADDLELLAMSAYLTGHERDFRRCLERAHHTYLQQGNQLRAARCTFWLGLMLLLGGESAQATGWLGRAQRLVEGNDCVECGYLLLPMAEQQLSERNADAALTTATEAAGIGDRFDDVDLTACARHQQGRALIELGQVQRGLALLDEAMIAVSEDELSPIMTGLIYCSVIDACQEVLALGRAREWTLALGRWCDQQPEMVSFTGTCLVHRAEVMQLRGDWTEAMTAAIDANDRVLQKDESKPLATSFYRRGEIHRLRGEWEEAEEAYRTASRLGSEPQPGLALLRIAQERTDAAYAAIRRVLNGIHEPLRRAKLLPAYVEIALVAGDTQEARSASDQLSEIADHYSTDVLQAMAAQARGAVAMAEGDPHAALTASRGAFELWQRGEAPYDIARARLLTALACRELGDLESADLEFDAARHLFEQLGAAPDVASLDSLRRRTPRAKPHGLTGRELEILREIAAGKTNKVIATELFVSERTIDRHVSNILTKLAVPSRAAATAYAYSHKLL